MIEESSSINKILKESKNIAIIGASSKPERDSYKVMQFLIERGYKVFPINPFEKGQFILGQKCYPSLSSVEEEIDIVDIFRNRNAVMEITKQAIKIKAKVLWMQLNIIHKDAADLAAASGMIVVMDRCPKIELLKTNCDRKI